MPAGDWNYTVVGWEPGIDDLVQQFNQFNEEAPEGSVYARARIRAEYVGEGTGNPLFIQINLVGDSGTTYGADAFVCCSPENQELQSQPETFSGGFVEGWVYYIIQGEDAFGQILAFAPNVEYTDVPGGVGFFIVAPAPG